MSPVAHWTPADGMAALDRCRRAWERTSPQLIIDGWLDMLDELDKGGEARRTETATAAASLVEPVAPHTTPAAGSTPTNGGTA